MDAFEQPVFVALAALGMALGVGCFAEPNVHRLDADVTPAVDLSGHDYELGECQKRIAALLAEPAAPGAPVFAARRIAILGRAFGEPLLFVAEPAKAARDWAEPYADGVRLAVDFRPRIKMQALMAQTKKADLRRMVLRDGYVYADNPHAAYALVRELTYADLFDEPIIYVERGAERFKLVRQARPALYRHDGGRLAGQPAKLYFGDRAGTEERQLERPLHRDLRELQARLGFDRITPEHVTEHAIVARLHFGERSVRAVLDAAGARLEPGCLEAPRAERDALDAWRAQSAWRRRALVALHRAVDAAVTEELPFDRPYDAKDHLDDGKLRPSWEQAYKLGQSTYGMSPEGHSYFVFDTQGRPFPPETCVAMIVDCYERASGTWYKPRGEERARTAGGVDFKAARLDNRSGVLAFEQFGVAHPELFVHRRFTGAERIAFEQRDAFFAYLLAHAADFAPGDVVAIQGPKPDGYVHQHAILIENVDPITGFPYGMADQMKLPRRRSWEGIMGEAPKRALLYHLHPTDALFQRLARDGS